MLRSVDAYTLTGSMKIPRFIPVTYVGSPDFDATQNKKHEDYLKPDELAAYRVRNDSPNIWVETPNDKYVEGIVYFYEQLGDNPNGMVLVRTGDIGDQ